MVDVKLSQLAAQSPASAAAGAALWSGKGFIQGLVLEYVSPTQVRVGSGVAHVPDAGFPVELASAVTKTISGIGNSAWGHIYLVYAAGVAADIEVVTPAPAAPYQGTARAKSGAGGTSRRYLGSIKTDASGNIIQFVVDSTGAFRYLIGNPIAPLRCLSNGKAVSRSSVSLSGAIPVTAIGAILIATNTDTGVFANLSTPSAVSATVVGIAPGGALAGQVLTFPTDNAQAVDYYFATLPANGLYLDVVGFTAGR